MFCPDEDEPIEGGTWMTQEGQCCWSNDLDM